MRLNIQQVRRSVIGSGRACAAALVPVVPAVLLALAPLAHAQSVDESTAPAASIAAATNAATDVVPATTATLAPATPDADADAQDLSASAGATQANVGDDASAAVMTPRPAADPVPYGDESLFASTGALDDSTLSRQRGGAVGMVMVAATPQLMRGVNGVTLWDEIAPPAPLPIPVDASQNAQGNVANYTRK
ncbi:hypothetical protein [Paraburkholderia sp. J41]|uniref:hypothetical protein n=1 Tax=Paraburkholderia sp. J41 TaxID=2805433 RepID=UPI002AC34851|nr:hypothetical protein [Paraburkholderia sp. J41]